MTVKKRKRKENLRQAQRNASRHHVWTNPPLPELYSFISKYHLSNNKPEAEETLNINGKRSANLSDWGRDRELFCVWVVRAGHNNTSALCRGGAL